MDFAKQVLEFQKIYPHIRLEIVLRGKRRHEDILSKADKVTILDEGVSVDRYKVDGSKAVLCVWNAQLKGRVYQALRYAEKTGKKIKLINLPAFLPKIKEIEERLYQAAKRN